MPDDIYSRYGQNNIMTTTQTPGAGFAGAQLGGLNLDALTKYYNQLAAYQQAKQARQESFQRKMAEREMALRERQAAPQPQERLAGQQAASLQPQPQTHMFATDLFGMTPFTGMTRTPWSPGQPNYSMYAPVATGSFDNYNNIARAQALATPAQTWEQFNRGIPQPQRTADEAAVTSKLAQQVASPGVDY